MIATFRLSTRNRPALRTRGTDGEQSCIVNVSYEDADPEKVIEMVEETLAIVKKRYASAKDRPIPPVEDDDEDELI